MGGSVRTNNGKPQIPLGELVDIKHYSGPPMISSEDALLRSVVFLNVRDRDMGSFVNEAKEVLDKELVLPRRILLHMERTVGKSDKGEGTSSDNSTDSFFNNICDAVFYFQ